MSTYESISLMIGFGMLILTLVSLIIVILRTIIGAKK